MIPRGQDVFYFFTNPLTQQITNNSLHQLKHPESSAQDEAPTLLIHYDDLRECKSYRKI